MDNLNAVVDRLESIANSLQSVANNMNIPSGGPPKGGTVMAVPAVIKMFDGILDGPLAEFLSLSSKIGDEVNLMGSKVKSAFTAQRQFLAQAVGQAKPGDEQLMEMLRPCSTIIEDIQHYREKERRSALFNHLSAISESIPALGWVAVAPAPSPFIKEMSDASQFYTNRIRMAFKEKDETHIQWVKAWLEVFSQLQQYVKDNHTTGLEWNTSPGCVVANSAAKSTPPAPPGGPPPPPGGPPPPPPPLSMPNGSSDGDSGDSRAALFAEINKGLDITSGLKKVTADMQTHKNPELRTTSVVPEKAVPGKPDIAPKPSHLGQGAAPSAGAKPKQSTPPPVTSLEGGKKWVVEFHKGNKNIVINVENMKQVVYIYKCEDSVIQIKGKANSITMDSCKKTSVVFDALLSAMEIINCQRAQVQTLGAMPTLAIQKTDGCQVYLSKESLESEIVTSKSSEMNILVPDGSGDFKEFALPEQYKTVFSSGKLETSVVDIA